MKTSTFVVIGGLAIANAFPQSLNPFLRRQESVGATPVDYPVCALKHEGATTDNPDDYIPGFDPDNLQSYWNDLKDNGSCAVKAKKCSRVTCGNTSAIYVCNDNDFDIAPDCATVAEWVGDPLERTGDGGYHITQSCGCGQYSCDHATGELTFEEGWRIQVGYGNCNHPSETDKGIFEE